MAAVRHAAVRRFFKHALNGRAHEQRLIEQQLDLQILGGSVAPA